METASDLNRTTRCVVWHCEGAAAPESLILALRSRGLRVESGGSGHEVLSMACRQQRLVEVDGGKGGKGLIVVLDAGAGGESGGLNGQGRVLEAMERFSPSAIVWVYEEGANPPIKAFVGEGAALTGGLPAGNLTAGLAAGLAVGLAVGQRTGQMESNGHGRSELRISGATQVNGSNGKCRKNGNGVPMQASDVLDHDELAALLGSEDD